MNLHKIWDAELVSKAMEENFDGSRLALEQNLLQYIENAPAEAKDSWLACADGTQLNCTMGWANEELEIALRYAYVNDENGIEIVDGDDLMEAYYERAWPVLKEQMAKAAVRMAYTFNKVF